MNELQSAIKGWKQGLFDSSYVWFVFSTLARDRSMDELYKLLPDILKVELGRHAAEWKEDAFFLSNIGSASIEPALIARLKRFFRDKMLPGS